MPDDFNNEARGYADLAADGPPSLVDLLRGFIALREARDIAKAELERIEELLDGSDDIEKPVIGLGPALRDVMIEAGIQNTKIDGKTVYLNSRVWCSKRREAEKQEACDALKGTEFADLVREDFNTQSLSSAISEKIRAREDAGELVLDANEILPEAMKPYFDARTRVDPRVRNGRK